MDKMDAPKKLQPRPEAGISTGPQSVANPAASAGPRPLQPRNKKLVLIGAAVGLAYGLVLRWGAQSRLDRWTPVMSISFLLLVPFAVGFITVFVIERRESQRAWVGSCFPGFRCWEARWAPCSRSGKALSASSCSRPSR